LEPWQRKTAVVDIALIRLGKAKPDAKPFGPFTSVVSCSALLGIYIGMASILLDKY